MSSSMPFDTYLRDPYDSSSNGSGSGSGDAQNDTTITFDDHRAQMLGLEPSAFCNSIQFQMPSFMMAGGPPLLAPGGGAEVLTPMFGSSGAYNASSSWFKAMSQSDTGEPTKYFDQGDMHLPSLQQPSMPFDFPANVPSTSSALTFDPASATTSVSSPSVFAPSAHGLPVYSASGFDMLSILSRVATRPHPTVVLGPVDLTCSFVVVDVRRYDSPIVYASPSFCTLTGYTESEAVGRNCRFLQAPDGRVDRSDKRRYTAPEAVAHIRRSISANKECQVSLINYRKGGSAFINLVTIIPVPADDSPDEIAYHVGFQVDLTEQPNAILQRLRDGSYIVNYSSTVAMSLPAPLTARDRAANAISADLRTLLSDPAVQRSLKFTSSSTAAPAGPGSDSKAPADTNMEDHQSLNLLLLEHGPDFVHVLSLKGYFLYVSPSVRNVLGYEADELLGKSITEYCHPSDIVPLIRELKESSTLPSPAAASSSPANGASTPTSARPPIESLFPALTPQPKTVDLLFRARAKDGSYVWVECLGRLHVEPGKGRKAVVLSGRVRSMPTLGWDAVSRCGGLVPPITLPPANSSSVPAATSSNADDGESEKRESEREFWGMLSKEGTFLVAGAGVRDVLGYGAGEMIGRTLREFVVSSTSVKSPRSSSSSPPPHIPSPSSDPSHSSDSLQRLNGALKRCASPDRNFNIPMKNKTEVAPPGLPFIVKVPCEMTRRDGTSIPMCVVLYGAQEPSPSDIPHTPAFPVVCQFKYAEPQGELSPSVRIVHPPTANIFEELETGRETSWQYELQQLKFENRRLMEEIKTLESGGSNRQSVQASQSQTPSSNTTSSSKSQPASDSTDPVAPYSARGSTQQQLAPIRTQGLSSSKLSHSHNSSPYSSSSTQQLSGMTYSLSPASASMRYSGSSVSLGKRSWTMRGDDGPS